MSAGGQGESEKYRRNLMRHLVRYAAVIALAAPCLWSAEARCGGIDATRETIIQSVRDDVRHKIQERRTSPPQHAHSPKQDIPRQ
jgi:hypothetical protein